MEQPTPPPMFQQEKFAYLWRNTKYGPTHPEIVKRMDKNMPCECLLIGNNGTRWIRFSDGYEAAVLFRSIGKATVGIR